jgi:hypothetical protein
MRHDEKQKELDITNFGAKKRNFSTGGVMRKK